MQVNQWLNPMTREEKVAFLSGKDFWHLESLQRLGIPQIMVADGPHGLRKQAGDSDHVGIAASVPATCFPTGSLTACSFDRSLIQSMGEALGDAARSEGVSVLLGPGINIKRSPLCGRNFEYFSEDPLLAGELGAAWINGVQSRGVGTSLKHFAVNNQEAYRMVVDAVVDDRALREIYLRGFEIAVKKGSPWTVMGAYNRINGTYACEHGPLLQGILREEWGFDGVVLSDWGAVNDRVESLRAGLDLEMPSSHGAHDGTVLKALDNGLLADGVLEASVSRILSLIHRAVGAASPETMLSHGEQHQRARRVARESMVLLKNAGGILPLAERTSVALLGAFAKTPRIQGAGSSVIHPLQVETLQGEMQRAGRNFQFAPGYDLEREEPVESLLQEAEALARKAEVAVVLVGLLEAYESEGYDRPHMELPPAHRALVERVAKANPNVVVVLLGGGAMELPFAHKVPALLYAGLSGQAGASALVELLYGAASPSGRLAETWPVALSDTPAHGLFQAGRTVAPYRESIYVGYRYYQAAEVPVRFPFGHGLSYATFEFKDLTLLREEVKDQDALPFTVKVRNTGDVEAATVVQLYVGAPPSAVFRPRKELRGFEKVRLKPGEETTVSFVLTWEDLAYFNTETQRFHAEEGAYTLHIGASSEDIRLEGAFYYRESVKEERLPNKDPRLEAYQPPLRDGFAREAGAFEALLGRPIPEEAPGGPPFHMNSTLGDLGRTRGGRLFLRVLRSQMEKRVTMEGQGGASGKRMVEAMLEEAPLRSLVQLSGGMFSRSMAEGVLEVLNGHPGKGLKRILALRKSGRA